MLTKKNIQYADTLWKQAKIRNHDYTRTSKQGRKHFDQFDKLGSDVFDEVYSSVPEKIIETDNNSWATNYLNTLNTVDKDSDQDISEFDILRKRCQGNKLWSEISTDALLKGFLNDVPRDTNIQSTDTDEDTKAFLERMLADMESQDEKPDEKDIDQLKDQIDNLNNIIKDKKQNQDNYNNNVNEQATRQSVREFVKQANEDINDVQQAINSFSFGDSSDTTGKMNDNTAKKLSKYVKDNDKIKKVMELLGRMKRQAESEIKNKPKQGTDEIVGIELGNNISKVLPSQLMYLSDSELEPVFLKRFTNHELLQYELSQEPPKSHGPIIICLDCSSSMSERDRSEWSLATTLAFLHIAKMQNRPLQVIQFNGDVQTVTNFDNKDNDTTDKALELIDMFYPSGGTNFNRPLQEAINTLAKQDNYNDADILMITDGEASISDEISEKINYAKDNAGLKVFSIIVGNDTDTDNSALQPISNEVISLKNVLKDSNKINKLFAEV